MRLGPVWFVAVALTLVVSRRAPAGDFDAPPSRDPTGSISIQLPVDWAAVGVAKDVYGSLQHWAGSFSAQRGQNLDADLYVRVMPAYGRATLARWGSDWNRRGKIVDGSVRSSAGMVEEVRFDPEWQRSVLIRLVEGEGLVFELAATARDKVFPQVDGQLRALFDTFKVLKRPDVFPMPAGYATSPDDARVVWTDTQDKKGLKRVLDFHAAGWKAMGMLLPGAPVDGSKPIVVVCDDDSTYAELTALGTRGAVVPACSMLDYQRRAVLIRLSAKTNQYFDTGNRADAARQRCQRWFGGPTEWIEHGMFYLLEAGLQGRGMPDKPVAAYVQKARQVVALRKSRLDELMELHWDSLKDADAVDSADMDSFAWQYFLRYGGGAKAYGARFAAFIEAVRKDGDPTAAAASAFQGVDFESMRTAFEKWAETWKP